MVEWRSDGDGVSSDKVDCLVWRLVLTALWKTVLVLTSQSLVLSTCLCLEGKKWVLFFLQWRYWWRHF
eukprot:11191670-Ditylum_brightwellii.AAC.1